MKADSPSTARSNWCLSNVHKYNIHMINLIIIILSEYSTVLSCMSPQKRSITKYRQVMFYAISFCRIFL